MECVLYKVQYIRKTETTFNIRLINHGKDVSNLKSICADLRFRKHGYSFNLHVKFRLIKQMSVINTTSKGTLKF